MSKNDLLSCPFCGSDNIAIIKSKRIDGLFAAETWNARASGWIPCSRKMPEDNTEVLVYDDSVLIATFDSNEKYTSGWMEAFECRPLTNVTHWMPLPSIPEMTNNV